MVNGFSYSRFDSVVRFDTIIDDDGTERPYPHASEADHSVHRRWREFGQRVWATDSVTYDFDVAPYEPAYDGWSTTRDNTRVWYW